MEHDECCPVCALADKVAQACEGADVDDVFRALLNVLCSLIGYCTDPRDAAAVAHRVITHATKAADGRPDHLHS